ncbi:PREDICTED: ecdysone-induced protein 74EF-like [Nicrophorus vespilloides]|uniref:Ecdysone-induced protein 74EF-like n=1 Tax=Nicrophorus vespilloides TaxID=110193 RepID=A0ABM1M2P3_NICVS|nr:PREDICTED: ecdysone-induced protein 74EF-like [Nicrophorus vespilloides]XP_017768844.1 PREDICTED: ecdysone-induced protein 74EF-like [Nicrophorus vespilloides]
MSLAMPFIDNDLLWCPDNDGKMVDLSSCLQDAASVAIGQQTTATGGGGGSLGELSQSDLSSLVPAIQEEQGGHMPDTEDIFKHLTDPSFELDNLLNEFNSHEIKQEENNNNIPNMDHTVSSSSIQQKNNTQVMLEMRSTAIKFTIAAANPLLAEKLAAPTSQNSALSTTNSVTQTRPQMAPLTPKIEKGTCHTIVRCM